MNQILNAMKHLPLLFLLIIIAACQKEEVEPTKTAIVEDTTTVEPEPEELEEVKLRYDTIYHDVKVCKGDTVLFEYHIKNNNQLSHGVHTPKDSRIIITEESEINDGEFGNEIHDYLYFKFIATEALIANSGELSFPILEPANYNDLGEIEDYHFELHRVNVVSRTCK